MAIFLVTSYSRSPKSADLVWDGPHKIEATDAIAAVRQHPLFGEGCGEFTHVLGGREFQAHWQRNPATGRTGIEAVHEALDAEKIAALKAIRLHNDRRLAAAHMIDA